MPPVCGPHFGFHCSLSFESLRLPVGPKTADFHISMTGPCVAAREALKQPIFGVAMCQTTVNVLL